MDVDRATVAIVPLRPEEPAAHLTVAGRTVLDWTLQALIASPRIDGIVLALDRIEPDAALAALDARSRGRVVAGARCVGRIASLRAALELVPAADTILVHEPDRPLLSPAGIDDLLAEAPEAPAAVTALPVRSSIKRVSAGIVTETVPRERLYAIQSPSRFRRAVLEAILAGAAEGASAAAETAAAGQRAATEAHELDLARSAGVALRLVPGSHFNVPVATSADARFAELAVSQRLIAPAG